MVGNIIRDIKMPIGIMRNNIIVAMHAVNIGLMGSMLEMRLFLDIWVLTNSRKQSSKYNTC